MPLQTNLNPHDGGMPSSASSETEAENHAQKNKKAPSKEDAFE